MTGAMHEPPPPSPAPSAPMVTAEAKANVYRMRLALQPLIIHFQSNGYIRDKTMGMLDTRVLKQVQGATARLEEVRLAFGRDREIWRDLQKCFEVAVPSLERRSVPGPDPNQPEFDSPSGPLIAQNYATLIRDIERINDLVCISKNVLASGDNAQDNAAKSRFDQAVFRIINVCVKVTARGYDGDAGVDEEKWQTVVNDYKKLLISCLQFLNNLVAQNERRKLMLWVQLFDSATDSVLAPAANGDAAEAIDSIAHGGDDTAVRNGALDPAYDATATGLKRLEDLERRLLGPTRDAKQLPVPGLSQTYTEAARKLTDDVVREGRKLAQADDASVFPPDLFAFYTSRTALKIYGDLTKRGQKNDANHIAQECCRRWLSFTNLERNKWRTWHEEVANGGEGLSSADKVALESTVDEISQQKAKSDIQSLEDLASQLPFDTTMSLEVNSYLASTSEPAQVPPLPSGGDYKMAYSSEYGVDILQRGKDDLMKRLEPYVDRSQQMPGAMPPDDPPPAAPGQAPQPPGARRGLPLLPSSSEYLSEAESEEEDYGLPGDDGRGLLTDVPLILGPNEIEVLPMIILSSIVPPPTPATPGYGRAPEEVVAISNMHTVRCHFFLAQENGRNLLRELLIFVAAWDLREDELYFKFMVKIMESILNNGLMPFSYHAFRESKDIISPAQAVIMKLLTNIFRLRQTRFQQQGNRSNPYVEHMPHYPTRVDVHMVNFLLTEFRRHIIPQTCALIFLQGQIRAGRASPEDFPLNLWDMERMYEGIYQYLEFFAILTECDAWKQMMAEWDITCELVTLLKELDAAIPRSFLAREMGKLPSALRQQHASVLPPVQQPPQEPQDAPQPQPVAVERPYDPVSPVGPHAPESTLSFAQPTATANGAAGQQPPQEDEPSEFPWKNLKKLTVLVLSSLTWKSQRVQDQVRQHGGMEVVLNCTKHDDFNPYIREHAIMALRFLVEGNDKNREAVRYLEAKAAETARAKGWMPGQIAARGGAVAGGRKKAPAAAGKVAAAGGGDAVAIASALQQAVPPNWNAASGDSNRESAASGAMGSSAAAAAASTGLFDLMKEVMREMPTRVRGQALDKHKTELLRQLDQEFD